MTAPLRYFFLCSLLCVCAACAKNETVLDDAAQAKHEHHPPHGGTPVVLGAELYHLELVLDSSTGHLSAYVLDGEMENFIRIAAPSFDVTTTAAGKLHALRFTAVANSATGESVGNTAQFDAQADWLKTTPAFDATLTRLEIRGTVFTHVAFNFPGGNDRD